MIYKAKVFLDNKPFEHKFPKDGYVVLKNDNTVQIVESTEKLELSKMQELVGGYVEYHKAEIGKIKADMLIDEEGLMKNSPLNKIAFTMFDYPLVGNVVILFGKCKLRGR